MTGGVIMAAGEMVEEILKKKNESDRLLSLFDLTTMGIQFV